MTIEVATEAVEAELPPPGIDVEAVEAAEVDEAPSSDAPAPPPPRKSEGRKIERKPSAYVPLAERSSSQVARALREGENKTLRELIESFGPEGGYQVHLLRKEPREARDASGKMVKSDGFLDSWENPSTPIDEKYIQKHFGGGTYELKFKERKSTGSGWQYAGQKVVHISGDPILVSATTTTPAAAPPTESPSIVKDALNHAFESAKRAEDRADARHSNRGDDAVVQLLRDQLATSQRAVDDLRRELRDIATKSGARPEDSYKDKLLDKMIDGDSARVTALRTQYDSEIRMLKENALANESRLRDIFERERQDLRNAHERELALLRVSNESQLAAAKSSFETQLAAAKSSFDMQIKLLEQDNKRLERTNAELSAEVKELRARKDKGIVEIAKELKTVKEALGEDDDGETSAWGRIAEVATNPEAWQAAASVFRQQPAVAPPPPPAPSPKRSVVKKDGKKFILEADGKTLTPVPEKKKIEAAPSEPQMPEVDPAQMQQIVSLLEIAFTNGQEPEIIAQGARSRVPEEVLVAIRDHGVDQVMSRMAKLSGTSPLSTQAGRNWLRRVGAALVGE